MRPTRAVSIAILAVALLAVPSRAQTPGWATVDVSGSITASLDMVQASNTFGPNGALNLFFVETGAVLGSNTQELDLFSSAPLGEGDHAAPACGFAPECAVSIFITPVSFEEGTLSNAGSSADGQGNCSMTIDFVDAQGVSGSFDCSWAEIGVTAHGEFDTTAGSGDGGGGDGGGGSGSNLPLWLGLGAAGTAAGAAAELARRRRRKRAPEPAETDCELAEIEFLATRSAWEESSARLKGLLARARLASREAIPEYRARLGTLDAAHQLIRQQVPTARRFLSEGYVNVRAVETSLGAGLRGYLNAPGPDPTAEGAAFQALEGSVGDFGLMQNAMSGLIDAVRRAGEAETSWLGGGQPAVDDLQRFPHRAARGTTLLETMHRDLRTVLDGSVPPDALGVSRANTSKDWVDLSTVIQDLGGAEAELGRAGNEVVARLGGYVEQGRALLQDLERTDEETTRKLHEAHRWWERIIGPPCNKEEYRSMEPR